MLKPEQEILIAYMKELWPAWKPSPAELRDIWSGRVLGSERLSYALAREAVQQMKVETNYNPQPARFWDAYHKVLKRKQVNPGVIRPNYGGFCLRCTEGQEKGRVIPIMYPTSQKPVRGNALAAAEDMLKALAGNWEIVEAEEYADMFRRFDTIKEVYLGDCACGRPINVSRELYETIEALKAQGKNPPKLSCDYCCRAGSIQNQAIPF